MSKRQKPGDPSSSEEELDHAIYQALVASGAIVPTTPQEVAWFEASLESSGTSPELDPIDLLENGRDRRAEGEVFDAQPSVDLDEPQLARAARFGKKLSSETEKRMAEARDRIDKEWDQED